jgi:3-hydroxyisobutyrate dehydrogenase-like beta-hydroxyacid dehydrogenase
VTDALDGRTLVQLTNGSEQEMRGQMARVRAAGGRMLAGGIVGYPRHIGGADTAILYSGDAVAFAEHEDTLACLAGGQRYLGEEPATANAVYVSAFGFYYAALAGFFESAALAARRGVPPAEFAAALPAMAALLLDHIADAARRMEAGDYRGDQATVDVHLVGSRRRQGAFRERGLQSLMTDAFVAYCGQAHDAGEGGEDIAALMKRIAAPPAAGD